LRSRQPGCAKSAHNAFEKSLAAVREPTGGSPTERDALLQDLARAEVELGGSAADVDAGLKLGWDGVQNDLKATLREMQIPEAKVEAMREVARRLAVHGEEKRATALTNTIYPTANQEKADALGAVGLELLAAGKADAAKQAAEELLGLYPAKKEWPALAASGEALRTALNLELPTKSDKPKRWPNDEANSILGRAEGLARATPAQWDQARQAARDAELTADDKLRAFAALAAADLDDKKAGTADVNEAIKRTQTANASPWLLLRLMRIGARAGVAPEPLKEMAAKIADPDLRGRAQVVALQAQLMQAKQAADPKVIDLVEAKTVAAWLARAEWARRTSGSAAVVKGWDAPSRVFGQLGVALGPQGDE
jgi:hypothetical protein